MALAPPDELLDLGVGDNPGLVENLGGMPIEGVGGLGAEVAVFEVKSSVRTLYGQRTQVNSVPPLIRWFCSAPQRDCKSQDERERGTVVG
jgi:hypothetical protein